MASAMYKKAGRCGDIELEVPRGTELSEERRRIRRWDIWVGAVEEPAVGLAA